ncbi:NADH dehydrogenase [ubiquinone] 1 beta subcomplex subunit 3 [Eurytemora carolleeae]|uniref:NADH dehydrogenase [ubiquinone] 1 beta subcomplex subunit 3 n=1 Tax=Eurytemora carolleeae TaxID=1294199 RepID=UPI000C75BB6F|nr:NADH dehydrogenase [ubiquinone] 1 beta subcomplex subunit 3 [Eurytemora carolleeae]|eukprot:XP_023331661.1 NADH dehydrogenase [ubiquinone] 1 beta subcomplex subunit 3-like [Eurytemora affinis]
MGGGELPHIPDWRTYTVGEHTPELLKTQRMLKSLGLKDPWLRNEVWRYDQRNPALGGTMKQRIIGSLGFRGLKYGLVIAVVTAGVHRFLNSHDDHGHGHESKETH